MSIDFIEFFMGIVAKHAYRFVYLKSDKWKDVRFEALARDKSCCRICDEEDFSNDAHHVYYPESIWRTESDDLVILCRACHQMVQDLFFQQSSRGEGKKSFDELVTIIRLWMAQKKEWIKSELAIKKQHEHIEAQKTKPKICQGCNAPCDNRVFLDVFKSFGGPDGFSCCRSLCPECYIDIRQNCIVRLDDPNPLKVKGFAFRAVRVWTDKRVARRKELIGLND